MMTSPGIVRKGQSHFPIHDPPDYDLVLATRGDMEGKKKEVMNREKREID